MSKDTIIQFKTAEAERTDLLTDLLRTGAQTLIANAVEAELLELLGHYSDSRDEQRRQVIVRNGYLPEREIQRSPAMHFGDCWCGWAMGTRNLLLLKMATVSRN